MDRRIARSAGVVSAAILLSRVTGLVREMVMARLFGAGQAYDAFLLAFRIPNLSRDLFAEGALSSAFVPVFTRYLATRGKAEAARLYDLVATALLLGVGAFCALGILLSPWLVDLLAPGFARVPGKFELAVALTRIMFPVLLLISLAAQAMGVLNACDRFGVPALASTLFNLGSVAAGLLLGYRAGIPLIYAMAVGALIGGLLQFLWQVPSLVRAGFVFRPRLDWSHPGLRAILLLMGPAVLGNAAGQINILVNTNIASGITDAAGNVVNGPVSWLGYAHRFMQLPLGVFGAAIGAATLPAISLSAATGRIDEFRHTLSRSLGAVLLFTIPSAVGLVILGEDMIAAVFESGRFTAFDTHQTFLALAGYAAGLAGVSGVKILAPAFYALGDSRSPMLVSIASILVNLATALGMVKLAGFGHAGLALSTSLVALFGAAALFLILRLKTGGLCGRDLLSSLGRILAASAVMAVVSFAASRGMAHFIGLSRPGRLGALAVAVPTGVLAYGAMCRALRVPEFESAWSGVLHSVKKCFPI